MKITHLAALLALAGTTAAMAAPRETTTFTNINSNGLIGNVANAPVENWAVAGTDGGGAYNAQFLSVVGTLADGPATANWSQEQQILVTPPVGQAFIVSMFTGTTFTGTVSGANAAIPVGTITTAGNWTFAFHESFDDGNVTAGTAIGNAVDAIWNTVTFTLDDAAPAIPAVGSAGVTYTNVDSDGSVTVPATTLVWNNANPLPAIPGLLVRGAITGLRSDPALQISNPWSQWRIRVTPPNGAAAIIVAPGATSISTGLVNGRITLPLSVNPVGNWTFDFFEATGTTGSASASTLNVAGGPDAAWNQIGFELVDLTPSGVQPLAITNTGAWVSATNSISAAGAVAWFSFTAPATLTATGFLDLDTVGTSLTPANDTAMALYLATGAVVDSDLDDSTDLLSQLSYGAGNRFRSSNGLNFSGQDGTIVVASTTGISPGGNYFVAVTGGNASSFGTTGFNAVSGAANTGVVTLRGRSLDSGATIEAPPAIVIPLTEGGAWNTSSAVTIANAGIAWFTFTTPAGLTATGAVDVDFTGTSLSPVNDTDAAIYTTLGTIVDSDEDDGTDLLSQFSYGAGARSRTSNGANFLGQDGTSAGGVGNMTAATQYFIGVAGSNLATHTSIFNTTNAGANSGDITARVRVWNASAPTEPATPPATFIERGLVGRRSGETDSTFTFSSVPTDLNTIDWFRFRIISDALAAGPGWLDIDSEGTNPAANVIGGLEDTEIGVYRDSGLLVSSDDDDGSGWRSALSYGQTVPARAAINSAPQTGAVIRNGRDGPLVIGTYWAAVGTNNVVYNAAFFDVVPPTGRSTTNTLARVVNWRTNLAGQCGLSDIAGPGPAAGFDGELTADDIIFFINGFTANNLPVADITGPATPGVPDGELTADDIILFIGRFTAGCV